MSEPVVHWSDCAVHNEPAMLAGPCNCGGIREPTYDEIHAEAMRLWKAREMLFPAFTRRLSPDDLDYRSGAWGHMFAQAKARLIRPLPNPPASQGETP